MSAVQPSLARRTSSAQATPTSSRPSRPVILQRPHTAMRSPVTHREGPHPSTGRSRNDQPPAAIRPRQQRKQPRHTQAARPTRRRQPAATRSQNSVPKPLSQGSRPPLHLALRSERRAPQADRQVHRRRPQRRLTDQRRNTEPPRHPMCRGGSVVFRDEVGRHRADVGGDAATSPRSRVDEPVARTRLTPPSKARSTRSPARPTTSPTDSWTPRSAPPSQRCCPTTSSTPPADSNSSKTYAPATAASEKRVLTT